MTETLTLAAGWNNINTLLVGAGYAGRSRLHSATINNRSGGVIIIRHHTSATVAPTVDSGMNVATATVYTLDHSGTGPSIDTKKLWIKSVAGGVIDIDGSQIG